MKNVIMPLFENFMLLDFAGPAEVFALANRFLPDPERYKVVTLAASTNAVSSSNGVRVVPDSSFDQFQGSYDVLLVPGGPGAYNQHHPELYQWLTASVCKAGLYGSVCTGAFILAKAGLLNERKVTTHWNYTKRLAAEFPQVLVETDQVVVQDSSLVTSGGITTGIDLALSILERHHGRALAVNVAKVLLVVMRRQGGQVQFSPLLAEVARDSSAVSQVQQFVLAHLHEKFTVERMAELANMSVRNFSRLFQQETQLTPMTFVQHARVDQARKLLENSNLPMKTVAFDCGFGCVRQMSNLFQTKLGLTPGQYRQQFG
ncbi:GlxA family transcriptional regulator [Rheinheimera sp.]|uniref:GlxA family transcriptional regulator n=1 Tax=Rheinheimera sp. TaxID=1869214 RepID=UPI00307EF309